jgi:hypothetical protein
MFKIGRSLTCVRCLLVSRLLGKDVVYLLVGCSVRSSASRFPSPCGCGTKCLLCGVVAVRWRGRVVLECTVGWWLCLAWWG